MPIIPALIIVPLIISFSGFTNLSARLHIASQPKKDHKHIVIAVPIEIIPLGANGLKLEYSNLSKEEYIVTNNKTINNELKIKDNLPLVCTPK